MALASGKSIRWVADQLGHANPAFTLKTYAHTLPSEEHDLGFADFALAGVPERPYTDPRSRAALSAQLPQSRNHTNPKGKSLERETGLEPATLSMASREEPEE